MVGRHRRDPVPPLELVEPAGGGRPGERHHARRYRRGGFEGCPGRPAGVGRSRPSATVHGRRLVPPCARVRWRVPDGGGSDPADGSGPRRPRPRQRIRPVRAIRGGRAGVLDHVLRRAPHRHRTRRRCHRPRYRALAGTTPTRRRPAGGAPNCGRPAPPGGLVVGGRLARLLQRQHRHGPRLAPLAVHVVAGRLTGPLGCHLDARHRSRHRAARRRGREQAVGWRRAGRPTRAPVGRPRRPRTDLVPEGAVRHVSVGSGAGGAHRARRTSGRTTRPRQPLLDPVLPRRRRTRRRRTLVVAGTTCPARHHDAA